MRLNHNGRPLLTNDAVLWTIRCAAGEVGYRGRGMGCGHGSLGYGGNGDCLPVVDGMGSTAEFSLGKAPSLLGGRVGVRVGLIQAQHTSKPFQSFAHCVRDDE